MADIFRGNTSLSKIYRGQTELSKVYRGQTEVWTSGPAPTEELLLDNYPGAQLAYSVRKLSGTYAGACVRVRRSSDNTETDIGFNASNLLDTASLETFRGGSATVYITKWYDQSGNGYDLANTTTATQPVIYSGGLITTNGIVAVDFNSQFLTQNNVVDIANDTSYFIVLKPESSPAAQDGVIVQTQEDTTGGGAWAVNSIGFRDGGYFTRLNPVGSNISLNGVDTTNTNQHLISNIINYTGTSNSFYLNNTSYTTANNGRSNTGAGATTTIGTSADTTTGFDVLIKLQEFIFYPNSQSGNLSAINADINSFFSIYA